MGVASDVDLIMGTLSKSLASIGGFVAGPAKVIEFIRYFGRSMLFSTSLPPPSLAAADAALTILHREPEIVLRLQENAAVWRTGLQKIGLDVPDGVSPIVPVELGQTDIAMRMWHLLMEQGVYVNLVVFPAVAHDGAILRTSVMATHERKHLDQALEAMDKASKKAKVV